MSKKQPMVFPARIPRFAAGIRLQDTRGVIARSRWAKLWTQAIEDMGMGPRLGKGRKYACSGQVVALEIDGAGHVRAKVQGMRPELYDVTLDFRQPEPKVHKRILAKLRAEPILIARLFAGDLAMEVESIFRDEGFILYPGQRFELGKYDVTIDCSCPDWANPCKHSAAVMLILGEEVARRPELLLELRGFSRKELLNEK